MDRSHRSIDPYSGNLLWQPTADQVGTQNVTVRLTDSASLSVVQSFAIRVRGVDLPPAISSEPTRIAVLGQAYPYAVGATAPEGDALTCSLAQFPSDPSSPMHIDAITGVITWTPDPNFTPGPYPVKIDVVDSQGSAVEQAYTLVVSAPAVAPVAPPLITSGTTPARAAYTKQYSFTFTAVPFAEIFVAGTA